MNVFVLLGLGVILLVFALRMKPRGAGPKLYLGLSIVPLVLTVVVPMPFALTAGGQSDWARQTVTAVSRAGIALSFILFTIGAVLTVRAALGGDRRAAGLLALETALAGLPAAIVTAYTAMFRLL